MPAHSHSSSTNGRGHNRPETTQWDRHYPNSVAGATEPQARSGSSRPVLAYGTASRSHHGHPTSGREERPSRPSSSQRAGQRSVAPPMPPSGSGTPTYRPSSQQRGPIQSAVAGVGSHFQGLADPMSPIREQYQDNLEPYAYDVLDPEYNFDDFDGTGLEEFAASSHAWYSGSSSGQHRQRESRARNGSSGRSQGSSRHRDEPSRR